MYLRLYILVFSVVISVGFQESFAKDSTPASTATSAQTKDEIYLDDGNLEGSGNREVKYDLESSGSGIGPDDEDGDGSGRKIVPPPSKTERPPLRSEPVDPYRPAFSPDLGNSDREGDDDDEDLREDPIEEVNRIGNNDVHIMNAKDDRASFFAQPGMLAAVIGGTIVGLLFAILAVMFFVYRMRKKDEGSYPLDEPKRSPTSNSYSKNSNREFYA